MQIILTTPESKLRVRDGLFEVQFYNKDGSYTKAQHAPALIDSIWLHDGASMTVAALRLAVQNEVDVVICDRYGDPEARFMGFRPSTTSLIQKAQASVSISPLGMEYARGWVLRKLESQADYLLRLGNRRTAEQRLSLAEPLQQIRASTEAVANLCIVQPHAPDPSEIAATLRGLEGVASRAFFQSLGKLIPAPYRFDGRSRRPATDPFNAFLNYAFAVLYRKIERALIKAGLNPYIGFLHRDGYQFPSMVFDFIEPFRTDMVQAVFALFAKQSVKPSIHVFKRPDGACMLTKEGKELLLYKINRFYEKKVAYAGLSMGRDLALERAAQQFALSLPEQIGRAPLRRNSDLAELASEAGM